MPGRPVEAAGAQRVEFEVRLLLFGFSFGIVHVYLISAEAKVLKKAVEFYSSILTFSAELFLK